MVFGRLFRAGAGRGFAFGRVFPGRIFLSGAVLFRVLSAGVLLLRLSALRVLFGTSRVRSAAGAGLAPLVPRAAGIGIRLVGGGRFPVACDGERERIGLAPARFVRAVVIQYRAAFDRRAGGNPAGGGGEIARDRLRRAPVGSRPEKLPGQIDGDRRPFRRTRRAVPFQFELRPRQAELLVGSGERKGECAVLGDARRRVPGRIVPDRDRRRIGTDGDRTARRSAPGVFRVGEVRVPAGILAPEAVRRPASRLECKTDLGPGRLVGRDRHFERAAPIEVGNQLRPRQGVVAPRGEGDLGPFPRVDIAVPAGGLRLELCVRRIAAGNLLDGEAEGRKDTDAVLGRPRRGLFAVGDLNLIEDILLHAFPRFGEDSAQRPARVRFHRQPHTGQPPVGGRVDEPDLARRQIVEFGGDRDRFAAADLRVSRRDRPEPDPLRRGDFGGRHQNARRRNDTAPFGGDQIGGQERQRADEPKRRTDKRAHVDGVRSGAGRERLGGLARERAVERVLFRAADQKPVDQRVFQARMGLFEPRGGIDRIDAVSDQGIEAPKRYAQKDRARRARVDEAERVRHSAGNEMVEKDSPQKKKDRQGGGGEKRRAEVDAPDQRGSAPQGRFDLFFRSERHESAVGRESGRLKRAATARRFR